MKILITGASSGLGLASAEHFAKSGNQVVMLARRRERLSKAADDLRSKYPTAIIETEVLDVSDFDQVREFAKKQTEPIDVLMNNAGLMGPDFILSKQGIESQMATNHLGHFLLTKLLWPNLEKAESPRVIGLSSVVHRRGNLSKLSIQTLIGAEGKYDRWQRYADTKLACLLFARELDLRAKQLGSKVKSIAAHPGWAITGLQENFPHALDRFAQTATQGAQSQIFAATNALAGGEFVGPRFELWGAPKRIKGSSHSRDLQISQTLWELSEQVVGEKFFDL
jgi:NAD(P)-dependent dehydrogenase (short-subunit alcohol dehydrogenase family)